MNPDGSDRKWSSIDVQVFDYDWSPDGKWIAFARMDGSFASELYIVPATGPSKDQPIRNITPLRHLQRRRDLEQHGKKFAFLSQRRGIPNMLHILDLEKPTAESSDGKTPPASRTWRWSSKSRRSTGKTFTCASIAGRRFRRRRRPSRRTAPRSPSASGSSGDDLWVASSNGSQVMRLTTGGRTRRRFAGRRRASSGRST